MHKLLTITIGLFLTVSSVHASLPAIDINKISTEKKYQIAFQQLKDHAGMYDHWVPKWIENTPKKDVLKELHDHYTLFSTIKPGQAECELLLGDISHFLYNLDDTAYYQHAITHYRAAIQLSPEDFRPFWFLGRHFSLSNEPINAVRAFLRAAKMIPQQQTPSFWNDYAEAMALSSMPSHSVYAMDRVIELTGQPGYFEEQVGSTVRNKLDPMFHDLAYKKEKLWTVMQGEHMAFMSRPLGMRFLIDSNWGLQITDFENRQCAVIINPTSIKSKKGREISYTIGLIMKVANEEDSLSGFIDGFIGKYKSKQKIGFSTKYENMLAFEMKEKNMYQDMGGGHLYMLGIERKPPQYPGFKLEEPMNLPKGEGNEVTYYRATQDKNRFRGKIFYAILLDASVAIEEESLEVFKKFFDEALLLE